MFYRNVMMAMMMAIIGFVMFVPVAQAERDEFEGIACYSNTYSTLHFSPTGEIYVGSFEGKGIFRSTSKPYFESTFQLTAVMKIVDGNASWSGFQKIMRSDAGGDFTVWEFTGDRVNGSTVKLIYGTGKFKGATGEQKSNIITKAKPIVQGTDQVCAKTAGWIEYGK